MPWPGYQQPTPFVLKRLAKPALFQGVPHFSERLSGRSTDAPKGAHTTSVKRTSRLYFDNGRTGGYAYVMAKIHVHQRLASLLLLINHEIFVSCTRIVYVGSLKRKLGEALYCLLRYAPIQEPPGYCSSSPPYPQFAATALWLVGAGDINRARLPRIHFVWLKFLPLRPVTLSRCMICRITGPRQPVLFSLAQTLSPHNTLTTQCLFSQLNQPLQPF